ncbi:hypothetical protein K7432_009434 [Basidiobolus ranarum]|uniref:Peptidase M9 collagenase N-terminal domain-containing protein n=1 Tax=Basidiobolus ranarum TaxID=34480 RepID=A0ABR2WQ77_9FUNG
MPAKKPSVNSATPSAAVLYPESLSSKAIPGDCNKEVFSKLNPQQLVEFLVNHKAKDCMDAFLWSWDAKLVPAFSRPHFAAVLDRIITDAPKYDGTNKGNMYELWEFIHIALYHDWVVQEIDFTGPESVAKINQAATAFKSNQAAFALTTEAGDVATEFLIALDNDGVRENHLDACAKVLNGMSSSSEGWKNHSQTIAASKVMYLSFRGVVNGDEGFRKTVLSNPQFLDAMEALSGYKHLYPNLDWLLRDGINEYARLSNLDKSVGDRVSKVLQNILAQELYPRLSAPWVSAAGSLEDYFSRCQEYKACRTDVEAVVFPNKYSFDNGNFVVYTPLDKKAIEQMYYASKQVKSQFFRITNTDLPLANDPNNVLHMKVYGSRKAYDDYQQYLYGLDTNNGGMYIENGATFYTYQRRVPQDSVLTLEELFRHEYVHYLNGRWAVHGFFGEGPWYQGDRTTSMDEGMAEYLAGSTKKEGVKNREYIFYSIKNDNSRMTVNQLLHATYSEDGFRFYSYAGAFWAFLDANYPSKLRKMYQLLRANDVAGFDTFRTDISKDSAIQVAYNRYLDEQISLYDAGKLFVPDTSYVQPGQLVESTPAAIQANFRKVTGLNGVCSQINNGTYPRFNCKGGYSATTVTSNPDQVAKDIYRALDSSILQRTDKDINNFSDMNCYYTNPRNYGANVVSADYTCEGPLKF